MLRLEPHDFGELLHEAAEGEKQNADGYYPPVVWGYRGVEGGGEEHCGVVADHEAYPEYYGAQYDAADSIQLFHVLQVLLFV